MPREQSERFKIDAPFDEAMKRLLKVEGVDTDHDGDGDDGETDD